jgi:hypothetical protein
MQHIQPKSHMREGKMTEPQNQQEGIARTDPLADSNKAKPKRQRKKDINVVDSSISHILKFCTIIFWLSLEFRVAAQ